MVLVVEEILTFKIVVEHHYGKGQVTTVIASGDGAGILYYQSVARIRPAAATVKMHLLMFFWYCNLLW